MEAARSEPVKITRKSGEVFVLLNADVFEKMKIEIPGLRRFPVYGDRYSANQFFIGNGSGGQGCSSAENAPKH